MKLKLLMINLMLMACFAGTSDAHFGAVIPSDDVVTQEDGNSLTVEFKFIHPRENTYMHLQKPKEAFVWSAKTGKQSLLADLQSVQVEGFQTWKSEFSITRPGDYIFAMTPQAYWEPIEDSHIIHYTKVCVNAFGLEEGWDEELGLPIEIIPLTRPYGLWTGNTFQGIVKHKGNVLPFAEVEVEYYDQTNSWPYKNSTQITQVIKADSNGVFSYSMPKAGWWAFSALNTADWTLADPEKQQKPVEIGAVFWVKANDLL